MASIVSKKYKLGILPINTPVSEEEKQYIKANRDDIISSLVLEYMGIQDEEYSDKERQMEEMFKNKKSVKLKSTREEVFICSIGRVISRETHNITKYYIVFNCKYAFSNQYTDSNCTAHTLDELELL